MAKDHSSQIKTRARLKETDHGEILVFTIRLALFRLVCIVNIPPEGETEAPVYVKFRLAEEGEKSPSSDRSPSQHPEEDDD
jgi:hypothetical protein